MSTDALAALLRELEILDSTGDGSEVSLCACETCSEATAKWLRARGVVVLPADHPLRTGEPSEAMASAAELAANEYLTSSHEDASQLGYFMAALRAALAVLREPLDK